MACFVNYTGNTGGGGTNLEPLYQSTYFSESREGTKSYSFTVSDAEKHKEALIIATGGNYDGSARIWTNITITGETPDILYNNATGNPSLYWETMMVARTEVKAGKNVLIKLCYGGHVLILGL